MTNRRIYGIPYLMSLGVVILLWLGCGASESPVEPIQPTTGSLEGRVTPIEDLPITIQVHQAGVVIASAEADTDGTYRIDGIENGTYIVSAAAKGFETVQFTVQIHAGEITALNVAALKALEIPVSHLRGRVSNRDTKEPLKDVRVQFIDEAGNRREVLTGESGIFGLDNLPVEQQFTVEINHEKYEPQNIVIDPIPSGETETVTIELLPIQVNNEELPAGDGLPVGAKAPPFSLSDGDGKVHSLADYVEQEWVVLVFYRGNW